MAANLVIPTAIRALRAVVRKGIAVVRDRLPQAGHDLASIEPALARNTQRLNTPAARIRQQQQAAQRASAHSNYHNSNYFRYYTTANRTGAPPKTPIRSAVSRVSKTAPFASTLRPKLCGALPRSASGYSLGGSARYFSHTTAPAQVIQQVSIAMRAFVLSGRDAAAQKRRNTSTYTRGQIKMHLAAANTDRLAPGAYVDFHLTPSFTCMSENDPVGYTCLDNSNGGFMDELGNEMHNTISDINRVYQDLRRLSALGELPISIVPPATFRVHFRGCDAKLVTALCDEVGVTTGVIHEDERFAYDKLMAQDQASVHGVNWQEMLSSTDDETDWDRYSSIPSHEINNPLKTMVSLSNGSRGPHWEESAEDFYDEIDPGGAFVMDCGLSSSDGMGAFNKQEYMLETGGYVNPWVMPVAGRDGSF